MPEVYLNGGGPNYAGHAVFSVFDILDSIRSTLVSAGWTQLTTQLSANDDLSQSVLMRANAIAGGHQAWYRFSVVSNSANYVDGFSIQVQGFQSPALLRPSLSYNLDYIGAGTEARLWVIANSEAACICLRAFGGLGKGIHIGFLDRVEPTTDAFAYAIGTFYMADFRLTDYAIARSAHTSTDWLLVKDSYSTNNYLLASGSAGGIPLQGNHDRHTTILRPEEHFSLTASTNAGRNAFNGRLNGLDGKAVLGEYFFVEGRSNSADYTVTGNLSPMLYYRGNVQFAITGLASLSAFAQVEDAVGTRYISTGGLGNQGFRITA